MNLLLTEDLFVEETGFTLEELLSDPLGIAVLIVAALILLVTLVSIGVEIVLAIKYIKFNRKKNSCKLAGKDVARKLLDENGLQKIKVKSVGSILFGNSYSHFFKKIRLRRLTWKKDSLTSLAMAAQKTGLAILDKENDKDMKKRVALTPIFYFGPIAFIPIIIVGIILDILLFSFGGIVTLVSFGVGLICLFGSFIFQIMTLKTEKKAQEKAYVILRDSNLATSKEIEDMKELFHLYNIEYINNIILSFLEIIYRILITILKNSGKLNIKSKD